MTTQRDHLGTLGQEKRRDDDDELFAPRPAPAPTKLTTRETSGAVAAEPGKLTFDDVGRETMLAPEAIAYAIASLEPDAREAHTLGTLASAIPMPHRFEQARARLATADLQAATEVLARLAAIGAPRSVVDELLAVLRDGSDRWTPPLDRLHSPLAAVTERRGAAIYRKAERDHGEEDHPAVHDALARRGAGVPLPTAVRRAMEAKLRARFDRVRIHTDQVAVDACRALGARAFTVGEDIFFGAGMFETGGEQLLAHELTHVVQAQEGRTAPRGLSRGGDALEREAEAAEVVGAERRPPEKAMPFDTGVRRSASGAAIDEDARKRLAAARGSTSEPLPPDLRAQFERSLGADLSDVRVHTGAPAADAAKALAADAFAHGRDIFFAEGRYAPDTADGRRLLAHEVAHTVQSGPAAGDPLVSEPGDAVEREADAAADSMIASRPAPVSAGATAGVIGREKPKAKATPTITAPKTRVAVNEKITFTGSDEGTWKASSGKPPTGDKNGSFEWTAGTVADPAATITLTVDGQDTTQTIEVVAPTGVQFKKAGTEVQSEKKAGAGMLLDVTIEPLDINFAISGMVTVGERNVAASNVTGYFAKHGGDHFHHAFSSNAYVQGGNKLDVQDHAVSAAYDPPYETGSFSWSIPTFYQVFGADNGGPFDFHTSTQTFTMDEKGTVTVTKDGATTSRDAPKEAGWLD